MAAKPYYVYILRCRDDSLYIGITSDIERRMKAHLGIIKGGARYTKSHSVAKIEAAWKMENKSIALRSEFALKKLPRQKKLSLISEPHKIFNKYLSNILNCKFEVCDRDFLDNALNIIL